MSRPTSSCVTVSGFLLGAIMANPCNLTGDYANYEWTLNTIITFEEEKKIFPLCFGDLTICNHGQYLLVVVIR